MDRGIFCTGRVAKWQSHLLAAGHFEPLDLYFANIDTDTSTCVALPSLIFAHFSDPSLFHFVSLFPFFLIIWFTFAKLIQYLDIV